MSTWEDRTLTLIKDFQFPIKEPKAVRDRIAEEMLAAYTLPSTRKWFASTRNSASTSFMGPPPDAIDALVERKEDVEPAKLPVVLNYPTDTPGPGLIVTGAGSIKMKVQSAPANAKSPPSTAKPNFMMPPPLTPIDAVVNSQRTVASLQVPAVPEARRRFGNSPTPAKAVFDSTGNTLCLLTAGRISFFDLPTRQWSRPESSEPIPVYPLKEQNAFTLAPFAKALVYARGKDYWQYQFDSDQRTPEPIAYMPFLHLPPIVRFVPGAPDRLVLTAIEKYWNGQYFRSKAELLSSDQRSEKISPSRVALVTADNLEIEWLTPEDRIDVWVDVVESGEVILTLSEDQGRFRIHRFERDGATYTETTKTGLLSSLFNRRKLGSLKPGAHLSASPNGRWILYHRAEQLQIYDLQSTVDIDKDRLDCRTLTFVNSVTDWAISPDSTMLVVALHDVTSQENRLVVLDLETEEIVRKIPGLCGTISWRPGTAEVAVASTGDSAQPQRVTIVDILPPLEELPSDRKVIESVAPE